MNKKSTFLFILLIVSLFGVKISAADLFTTSAKTQVNIGETFDIYINVNSDGSIVNSAEGNISFPAELLSIVSINNNASIFSMWPEKPVFSNENGTMGFNGGLPNPGFSGSKGSVLKITFKANKSGRAPISIVSGSVYSNDGTGTDVLKGKKGITITVNESVKVDPVIKDDKDDVVSNKIEDDKVTKNIINNINTPKAPVISSADSSDLNSWFRQKDIILEWDIPKGVDAVQYSFDSKDVSIPNILKIPPLNNTKLVNVANGVSNFHIRFRNQGGWGEILHQKIKVDLISPEIISVESNKSDGLVSLSLNLKDIHSGLSKINIFDDTDKPIVSDFIISSESVVVNLPLLKSGDNKLKVVVYDNAGNVTEKYIDVNSPAPNKPTISVDKTDFKIGKENIFSVKSYPNSSIDLWIKDIATAKVDKVQLNTDKNGIAQYNLSNIQSSGIKSIWASVDNNCGDICVLSEEVEVNITQGKLISLSGLYNMVTKDISNIQDFIPWTIAIIFMLLYLLSFRRNKRNRDIDLIRELNKAEIDVYKIFKVLKSDAKKYKTMLKRNNIDVGDKDKKIIENLEQDLEEAESYFAKRIEKIEEELE